MNEDNRFCVYVHKDKEGVVKYVGSGTEYRAYQTHTSSHRGKKYAEFVEANGKPEVEILAKGLSKFEAEDLERELFDNHRYTILNNRRPASVKILTKEMFEEYLYYDETSKSCLRWKIDRVSGTGKIERKANSEAGGLKPSGYYELTFKGKYYRVHRIVCVLHDIEVDGKVVDHIDRDKSNNKISNLKVVYQKENMQNVSRHKLSAANTSGVQGVYYMKRGYWVASWQEKGKSRFKHFPIKNYISPEDAFNAAVEFRNQMVSLHYN